VVGLSRPSRGDVTLSSVQLQRRCSNSGEGLRGGGAELGSPKTENPQQRRRVKEDPEKQDQKRTNNRDKITMWWQDKNGMESWPGRANCESSRLGDPFQVDGRSQSFADHTHG